MSSFPDGFLLLIEKPFWCPIWCILWGMVYVNWTKRSAKGLIVAGSQVSLDFVLGMKERGLCSPF